MYSKAGIKAIAIAGINTLLSSPSYPLGFGLRLNSKLKISPYESVVDYRERKHRNMINFQLDGSTIQGITNQGNFNVMQRISHFTLLGGCDCQMIGEEATYDTNLAAYIGDVFNFCGNNNFMGMGFDFTLSPKGRELKVPLEVALPFDDAKTIIAAATMNESCAFLNEYGSTHGFAKINYATYAAPFLTAVEAPSGTALFNVASLDDWKINYKSKSEKAKLTNRDKVSYVTVTVEITPGLASASKILEILNKTHGIQLVMRVKMGSINEVHQFNAGVLPLESEFDIEEKVRQGKLTFSADIPHQEFHNALMSAISSNNLVLNL